MGVGVASAMSGADGWGVVSTMNPVCVEVGIGDGG